MSEENHKPPPKSGPSKGLRRAQSSRSGQSSLSPSTSSGLGAFWAEVKRRKVMRVAITYAVVAWLVIQVAATTFPALLIPDWALRLVTMCIILGFPVGLILAWAFELTPDGIKTTKIADREREDDAVSERQQRKKNWLAYGVGALLPTVLFALLAGVFYVKFRNAEKQTQNDAQTEFSKSVAVLPFANLSPDTENAFFADGVHEDILTNLAHARELLVLSRASTLRYRDSVKSSVEIGNELRVRYLVDGSVRRVGNRVRVTAQLIDASLDRHIWAQNYTRDLDDIFAIQSEVAKEIANRLQTVLSPEEAMQIERQPTENMEAYDYYKKFRQLLDDFPGAAGEEKITYLEKAVELDPDFADAWASLATECIFWWDTNKQRNDPILLEKAHYALLEAKRTGQNLPFYHASLASVAFREHKDVDAAIGHLLDAIAIDPTYLDGIRRLSTWYRMVGRLSEAEHYLERLIRINPNVDGNSAYFWLNRVYRKQQKWDEARHLLRQARERSNNPRVWRIRSAYIDFLEFGDKEPFLSEFGLLPYKEMSPSDLRRVFLFSRKPDDRINLLEEYRGTGFGSEFLDLNLGSKSLATALHWLDLGEREKFLREIKQTRTYLKEIVDINPMPAPYYWGAMAVCEGSVGNVKLLEEAIARTREITNDPFWKYRQQVNCEVLIAIAYLVLGDHDKAIDILEAAIHMDSLFFLNRELDLWFIFDRLRGNPRFDALLEDN